MTSPADGDQADEPWPAASGGPAPDEGSAGVPAHQPPHAPGAAPGHRPHTEIGSAAVQITSGDWPAVAADRIVDAVDTVRDKTTGPAQTAARAAVYGLMVVILAVVVVVLLIIFAIRGLDMLVAEFISWGGIWLPYLILGVIFIVAGTFIFRRRRRTAA